LYIIARKQDKKKGNLQMVPSKISDNERNQGDLFRVMLRDVVDPKHPMVILANSINWEVIEKNIEPLFCSNNGRPGLPIRMIVALLYLKNAYNLSDGLLLNTWLENPYWQFFTGGVYFEHKVPFDSSNMSNWRKRIGEDGLETLLKEILSTAVRLGFIKLTEFKKVNIDTTVQEKNIRFPTDARLYDRLREKLVKEAKRMNIELRQSYEVVSRRGLRRQSSYAHANQFKKARKQTKKLKVYLGRVTRDIRSKMHNLTPLMDKLLGLSDRLLAQKTDSKNKLYVDT
jgi:IS5 family transposase